MARAPGDVTGGRDSRGDPFTDFLREQQERNQALAKKERLERLALPIYAALVARSGLDEKAYPRLARYAINAAEQLAQAVDREV